MAPKPRPPEDRFFKKVVAGPNGCWIWTGWCMPTGHGRFRPGGRDVPTTQAYRWSYEFHIGPIPNGLTIDHLCGVPRCVNPDHLDPATASENARRYWRQRPADLKCKRGHDWNEENTYNRPSGKRLCRACVRIRLQEARSA